MKYKPILQSDTTQAEALEIIDLEYHKLIVSVLDLSSDMDRLKLGAENSAKRIRKSLIGDNQRILRLKAMLIDYRKICGMQANPDEIVDLKNSLNTIDSSLCKMKTMLLDYIKIRKATLDTNMYV